VKKVYSYKWFLLFVKKKGDSFYKNIDKNKDLKRGAQIFGCTLDFKKYNNL